MNTQELLFYPTCPSYHPNNFNILPGKDCEFIYGLGLSVLMREVLE